MLLSHPKICLPHFRELSKGESWLFLGTSFLSFPALAARCISTWFVPRLLTGCTVCAILCHMLRGQSPFAVEHDCWDGWPFVLLALQCLIYTEGSLEQLQQLLWLVSSWYPHSQNRLRYISRILPQFHIWAVFLGTGKKKKKDSENLKNKRLQIIFQWNLAPLQTGRPRKMVF